MRPALVATSHGTSDPQGQAAVAAFVERVRRRLPDVEVVDAFADVQEPTPAAAVARLHDAARPGDVGRRSVVLPLVVAPGFHVRVDMAGAASLPGSVAAATLGPDPRLVTVLVRRLLQAGVGDDDTVVLGSAGSTDPRARACFEAVARELSAAIGQIVPVGYVGGTGQSLAEVVATARARQADRRVAVASLLVAPGFFLRRLESVDADVVTRPLLDVGREDAELVDLVVDRYLAAASAPAARLTH